MPFCFPLERHLIMNILFIGDIMGRCGRDAVFELLPEIKDEFNIDYTIANGENASGGLGMNRTGYEELCRGGIDFFTMGNHTFSKSEIKEYIDDATICRPLNLNTEYGKGILYIKYNNEKMA